MIKLTEQDFVKGTWTEINWIIPFNQHSKEEYDKIPKQILENQEKAEKWDELTSNPEPIVNEVVWVIEENKRLKEILNKVKEWKGWLDDNRADVKYYDWEIVEQLQEMLVTEEGT